MRRMYSEKELQTIIHEVVGDYIEEGAFDESIANAVDAYLTEHPVDITALEGQDISLATLTSTGDVDVGGDLDVTGSISGAEIVEKMNGYSFDFYGTPAENATITPIYCGVVKNGNKLTLVWFHKVSVSDTVGTSFAGDFYIPADVLSKLYPVTALGSKVLAVGKALFFTSLDASIDVNYYISKESNRLALIFRSLASLTANTDYYVRVEATFLLSDPLNS